jgi:DNA ligase (NAD+)
MGFLDKGKEKITKGISEDLSEILEIEKKRELPLDIFLRSLGIPELGKKVSSVLANKYKTLDAILNVDAEEVEKIEGIGPVISRKVIDGLTENYDIIQTLLKYIEIKQENKRIGTLSGKSFVFTGSLTIGRKEAQKMVNDLGGETPSSVTKGLSFLVAGEDSEGSSKYKKAEKNGVKIISEEVFLNMLK